MTKKLTALFLALTMCLTLVACGGGSEPAEPTEEPTVAPTEYPFAEMGACAEYAIEKLKEVLKNPSSLIVNELYAVESDDGYIFAIDYSAENGFGGMNRDTLFLAVSSVQNGFSYTTYGEGAFTDEDNQKYTAQFYEKYIRIDGAYILNPETYLVEGIDVTAVDTTIGQRVELVGTMQGERSESIGWGGAWNFKAGDEMVSKVVYFVEGTDLEWYKQVVGLPYEITISAIQDEEGIYREAEIVEDEFLNVTLDERLDRFSYHDRKYLAYNPAIIGSAPLTEDIICTALDGKTFSLRSGKYYLLETITFNKNGSLDLFYISDGEKYTVFESWEVEGNAIIMRHTFVNSQGEEKTRETTFNAYQIDEARILLLDRTGLDDAMILYIDNE